jgi:hypothetical protein
MPPVVSTPPNHISFLEVVAFEQLRSQRYNHYFVVALLSPEKVGLRDLVRTAAKSLRSSDLLGPVGPDGRFHWACETGHNHESRHHSWPETGQLGIIMPETDRRGADIALQRITEKLGADGAVSVRYAVYPDNGTDPSDLLTIASTSAAAWIGRRSAARGQA